MNLTHGIAQIWGMGYEVYVSTIVVKRFSIILDIKVALKHIERSFYIIKNLWF